MKKNFLIPFLIVLALLMVTSCKKKEDPTNIGPVVTVAQEKNYEPKTLDKEIPMLTVNESNKEEVKTVAEEIIEESNKDRKLSFVYRGGSVLLRSLFTENKGEIRANLSEDDIRVFVSRLIEENPEYLEKYSVSFNGDTVTLSFDSSTSDEELSLLWERVKNLMDKMNQEKEESSEILKAEILGVEVSAELFDDKAEVILPSSLDNGKIDEFMIYLSNFDPQLASKAKYEVEDGVLSLYFTSLEKAEAKELWTKLIEDAQLFFGEDKNDVDEKSEVEKEAAPYVVANAEESPKPLLSPLTEAGKKVDRFSVSLSVSAKYNSGFDSDIKAAFDLSVLPSLSLGVSTGYEVKGYLPLSLRVRYDIPLLNGLYSYLEGGWRFGFKENKSSIIFSLGLGYELEAFDSFFVFGEVDLQMAYIESFKLMPSVAVGGRYKF